MREESAVLLRSVPFGTDGSRFTANTRREELGRCAGGAQQVLDGARAHLGDILMIEAKHGTYRKRCVLPQSSTLKSRDRRYSHSWQCFARGEPVPTRQVASAVHGQQIGHTPVG